jgi:ATP-dependent DNA helicase RecG
MTANQVDAALALPAGEAGAALLALPEDQWFDRKSVRVLPKDLGPPLTALANAEGGIIVVGLHDGQVEGCSQYPEKINSFRQAAIDFTVPPVRLAVSEVACVNSRGEDDMLLVVRVDPGERVHEVKTGECYLRVGDETRKLSYPQRQELEFDKGQAQYDGLPCPGVTMSDLDGLFLEDYRQSIRASSVNSLMRARNLLTRTGEITNAAYLLFGQHPQDVFPHAHVRVIRFLSAERGTGARLALEEGTDLRVEGPIPRCVTDAAASIDELLPRRRHFAPSGRFEATSIVPRDAWLEGLVNAIIHRSYNIAGDHIRVEIFPNRIEIESPGRFPGLPSPARPSQMTRFARNPRIARVCADLRIGQELGEGIKRIFDEMRFAGLAEPVYTQTGASVRLILSGDQPERT